MRFFCIISFLFASLISFAQPGGYTAGTFVVWNYDPGIAGARDHGFGMAVGFTTAPASQRRVVVHFEGDGETSGSGLTSQAPGKYLNDAGTNWNMKAVRANGDTIFYCFLTIFNTHSYNPSYYKADIEYFFANVSNLPDTANHYQFAISGFSGGCGRMWGTMLESGFAYSNVFGLTRAVATPGLGVDVTAKSANKRNTVMWNQDDPNGLTSQINSDDLFADLSGVKSKYYPATGGHSADSAMSIYGVGTAALTDSSKSWWRLIAEWTPPAPPPYPAASNSPRISVTRNMIFDRNGKTYKTMWGLFEGDTTKGMDRIGVSEPIGLLPFSSIMVLDSIYTKFQFEYSGFGASAPYYLTLNLYDSSKTLLLTKQVYSITTGTWQSDKDIDTTFKVRFVEIAANSLNDFNVQIKEMKIYGVPIAVAPSIYPGTTLVPITDLGRFGHSLNVPDDRLESIIYGTSNRVIDSLTGGIRVAYESNRFDYIPDGYDGTLAAQPFWVGRFGNDHINTRVLSQTRLGRFQANLEWLGAQGSIKNLDNTAGHDTLNNYVYLGGQPTRLYKTTPNADSTDPASWAAAKALIYKIAAIYGTNTSADTVGKVNVKGGSKVVGQGGFRIIEVGNEWNYDEAARYTSPRVMLIMLKEVYPYAKTADPNIKIYMGALTYMNNSYMRAVYMENFWTYGSKIMPLDGVVMNVYMNDDYDGQGTSGAANGISPERWRIRGRSQELKVDFDKMYPNKPVEIGESGYNITNGSAWGVPDISGKTREETSGDWIVRARAEYKSVRLVEQHSIYNFGYVGDYNFDSMLVVRDTFVLGANVGSKVMTKGYAIANMYWAEGLQGFNWFSDKLVDGDSTGVHVNVMNHSTNPNRKLYEVWRGTSNNSSTSNYTVNVGSTATSVTLYTTNYTQLHPDATTLTVTGGNVTIPTVSEKMRWLDVTYSSSPPAGGQSGIRHRRGSRIKWVNN